MTRRRYNLDLSGRRSRGALTHHIDVERAANQRTGACEGQASHSEEQKRHDKLHHRVPSPTSPRDLHGTIIRPDGATRATTSKRVSSNCGNRKGSAAAPANRRLSRQAVAGELPVERRRVDPKHFGGAWLVAALVFQNPHDVGSLDRVERGGGL